MDVASFLASRREFQMGEGCGERGEPPSRPGRGLADFLVNFLVKSPAETSLTRNFLVKPLNLFW